MKIRAVINTLGANRTESEHSQNLLQLLQCKGIEFEVDDIAQTEYSAQVRKLMHMAGRLYNAQIRESIPQLFVNDAFIGGWPEVRTLEDDGQLDAILTGARCPHVYWHFQSGELRQSWHDFSYCPRCDPGETLVLYVDSSYPKMESWYLMFAMLTKAGARFTLVDVSNPHSKIRPGTAWVSGNEISLSHLTEAVNQGIIRELVQKDRCMR